MKSEIKCKDCNTEVVIIEDKLFFSKNETIATVDCPICNSELLKRNTDGWFFVQSKKEYLKDLEIEKNKQRLTYPMP